MNIQEILKQIKPTSENIRIVAVYLKSINTKNYIDFHNWAKIDPDYSVYQIHTIWDNIINLLDFETATTKLLELHDSPKAPQDSPKAPQDSPKAPQDSPKAPQDSPTDSKNSVNSLQKIKNLDQLLKSVTLVTLRNSTFFLCVENAFNVFHILWFEKRWKDALEVYEKFLDSQCELNKIDLKGLVTGSPESIESVIDCDVFSDTTNATLNLAYGQIPFVSKLEKIIINDNDIVFSQEKRQYGKVHEKKIIFPDNSTVSLNEKDTLFVKHNPTYEVGDVIQNKRCSYYAIITEIGKNTITVVYSNTSHHPETFAPTTLIKKVASKVVQGSQNITVGDYVRVDIGPCKTSPYLIDVSVLHYDDHKFHFKHSKLTPWGNGQYVVRELAALPIGRVVGIENDDFMIDFRHIVSKPLKFKKDKLTLIAKQTIQIILDDIYLLKYGDLLRGYVRLFDITCDHEFIIENLTSGVRSTHDIDILIEHIGTPVKKFDTTVIGNKLLELIVQYDSEIITNLFGVNLEYEMPIIIALKAENWWMVEHILKEHFVATPEKFSDFYFPQETLDRLKSMATEEQWNSLKKINGITKPYVNPVTEDNITKILDSL